MDQYGRSINQLKRWDKCMQKNGNKLEMLIDYLKLNFTNIYNNIYIYIEVNKIKHLIYSIVYVICIFKCLNNIKL